jgi:uncharacterized membrane protein
MFCQNCGGPLTPNVVFCPACGQQQPVLPGSTPPPLPTGNAVVMAAPFIPPVGVQARGLHWIGQGWEIVKTDLGLFMGITVLYAVIASVGSFLTQGPMQCGFHIACMKKIVRGRTEIADLFLGFNFFVPALLAALVIGLFSFIGFLLCIIPGLVVASMYKFTYLFIVDKRMDFWPAMQASHAVVKNDYIGFILFLLALVGLNVIGVCCLIIGLLITIPISFMAITLAYRELVGFEPNTV